MPLKSEYVIAHDKSRVLAMRIRHNIARTGWELVYLVLMRDHQLQLTRLRSIKGRFIELIGVNTDTPAFVGL